MSTPLTRSVAALGLLTIAAVATVGFSGSAASAAATAPDATFARANEQSNLAEISLGTLAMNRGRDAATKALARQTRSDHLTAKSKLTAVAKTDAITLPSKPSPLQLSVAAQLKATPSASFDLMYAQAQVSAHQQALALARTEQQTTSNTALESYTAYYITIATMHLKMAQAEVAALGGGPSVVPAGNGGAAATNSSTNNAGYWGIGAGVALITAASAIVSRRRRVSPR